jgi:hypothetical protein
MLHGKKQWEKPGEVQIGHGTAKSKVKYMARQKLGDAVTPVCSFVGETGESLSLR